MKKNRNILIIDDVSQGLASSLSPLSNGPLEAFQLRAEMVVEITPRPNVAISMDDFLRIEKTERKEARTRQSREWRKMCGKT